MLEFNSIDVLNKIKLIESLNTRRTLKMVYESGENEDFKVIKSEIVKEYPEYGYRIVKEWCKMVPDGWEVARNMKGVFIGLKEDAEYICVKMGIRPEGIDKDSSVCSIGKCVDPNNENFGAYFGWSHRAIYGFKIGYEVKKGSVSACSYPVGFVAKTEEDCRNLAIQFAKEVS